MNITISGNVEGSITFNCQTYGCIPNDSPQRSLRRDCTTGKLVVTEFYKKLVISISDWMQKDDIYVNDELKRGFDYLKTILTDSTVVSYSDDNYTNKQMTLVPGSLVIESYEKPECRFKFQLVEI